MFLRIENNELTFILKVLNTVSSGRGRAGGAGGGIWGLDKGSCSRHLTMAGTLLAVENGVKMKAMKCRGPGGASRPPAVLQGWMGTRMGTGMGTGTGLPSHPSHHGAGPALSAKHGIIFIPIITPQTD